LLAVLSRRRARVERILSRTDCPMLLELNENFIEKRRDMIHQRRTRNAGRRQVRSLQLRNEARDDTVAFLAQHMTEVPA
jgi:hypothetical protein